MAGWYLARDELTMSALVLLGFDCLLRTGEILQIRPCDFIVDKEKCLVAIPSSKSGARNNSKESVSIHDPCALEVVQCTGYAGPQGYFQSISGPVLEPKRDCVPRAVQGKLGCAGTFCFRLQTIQPQPMG